MAGFSVAASQAGTWKEMLGNVSTAVGSIGFTETADLVSKVSAGLALFTSLANLAFISKSAVAMANRKLAAESVGLAAAHAWNPVGLAKLAVAGTAMASAALICNHLVETHISADLSTPSGRTAAAQTVGAIL